MITVTPVPIAYAVVDQKGDLYGISVTFTGAAEIREKAEENLDEAAACGHPYATRWALERLPIRVEEIMSTDELDRYREFGTPILDREP